jgi:hypothetical protein
LVLDDDVLSETEAGAGRGQKDEKDGFLHGVSLIPVFPARLDGPEEKIITKGGRECNQRREGADNMIKYRHTPPDDKRDGKGEA